MPPQYEKFRTHLPIMIMGCWCNYSNADTNSKQKTVNNFSYFNNEGIYSSSDHLILWLAMEEKMLNINYTLSILDKDMNCSITAQLKVRSIYDSQDPAIFLKSDHYFISLFHSSVRHLTKNFIEPIQLKIVIHEPEMTTPLLMQDIKNSEYKILNQYFEEYLSSYLSINADVLKRFSSKSNTKLYDQSSKTSMLPFSPYQKDETSGQQSTNSDNSQIKEPPTNSPLKLADNSTTNTNKKGKPLQYYSSPMDIFRIKKIVLCI